MLLKLWKYEWDATRGKLGVLTLATLGMALVAGIDLRMLSRGAYWAMYIPMGQMLDIGLFLFLIASFFSLFVYSFGIRLLLLYRFYKNKFTDQGYLTFTLPVSTQKIFLSSFLNTLMWMANSFVTVGLGIFLFALIGMPANIGYIFESVGIVFQDCLDAFLYGLPAIGTVRMFYPAFSCLSVLVAPVYLTIVPMTAVTVGAVLAKKHKILVAFLV